MKDIIYLLESLSSYPSELSDEVEIADYIISLSDEDKDQEFIEEYFRGTKAVLKKVPLDSLEEGDPDHNIPDEDKEEKYKKLNPKTIPPLVVEDNVIVDGNHRYRVAKYQGLDSIYIYDVIEVD